MNSIIRSLSLGLSLLCLIACQKEEVQEVSNTEPTIDNSVPYPNVDPSLWVYFERFEAAARERQLEVDLAAAGIEGEIGPLEGEHVAGQCRYSRFAPGLVTVDEDFWANSSERLREFIIFHELGHCYLNRGHKETAYTNGTCVSIMRSGLEDCRDNYRTTTRELYLDELFFPENF